ncbi:MAG: septum site-determining protein MinC [Clostridiales bacterium]|nr:septum site-determining protein MinC [Clostridiales bacterium]
MSVQVEGDKVTVSFPKEEQEVSRLGFEGKRRHGDEVMEMVKKLDTSGKFFKGASISVKYRGKQLTPSEEEQIKTLMAARTGAEIKSFGFDADQPESQPAEKEADRVNEKIKMRMLYFKGIEEGISKFHRGTVRSGNLVKFEGNVIIIGDVNPGGEVVATGNVIVMGSLRGMVHAGADGNKEAIVAALNLQPTQLRIADVITRSPDGKDTKASYIPEMASIKDEMVYIERFLPQIK